MEKIYRVQMNTNGMPNFSTAEEVAGRPMLDDGTLVVSVDDATAVTRVLVEDGQKNGDLYYADRPKGEWINKHEWDNGFLERECSLCGAMKPILMHTAKINFCPNCGADMRGADDE